MQNSVKQTPLFITSTPETSILLTPSTPLYTHTHPYPHPKTSQILQFHCYCCLWPTAYPEAYIFNNSFILYFYKRWKKVKLTGKANSSACPVFRLTTATPGGCLDRFTPPTNTSFSPARWAV